MWLSSLCITIFSTCDFYILLYTDANLHLPKFQVTSTAFVFVLQLAKAKASFYYDIPIEQVHGTDWMEDK